MYTHVQIQKIQTLTLFLSILKFLVRMLTIKTKIKLRTCLPSFRLL